MLQVRPWKKKKKKESDSSGSGHSCGSQIPSLAQGFQYATGDAINEQTNKTQKHKREELKASETPNEMA